jgi:hypothetical protein
VRLISWTSAAAACAADPGHGRDQKGGEDDPQGQGADVRRDLGADGHGQRSAEAQDGRLPQRECARLVVRCRPNDPDGDQGEQRTPLSHLLHEPASHHERGHQEGAATAAQHATGQARDRAQGTQSYRRGHPHGDLVDAAAG